MRNLYASGFGLCRREGVGVDYGLGKGLRGFLGEIVADAAGDEAVIVFAGEPGAIGGAVGVDGAVGVAFESDGGDGDYGCGGEALFVIVVFVFAFGEADAPAVIVDGDGDVVGVVERCGGAVECGVVEIPHG